MTLNELRECSDHCVTIVAQILTIPFPFCFFIVQNRVVRQNPAERNFHIFYALLAGNDEQRKSKLQLWPPKKYYYLSQSGCVSDPTINDEEDFKRVEVRRAVESRTSIPLL